MLRIVSTSKGRKILSNLSFLYLLVSMSMSADTIGQSPQSFCGDMTLYVVGVGIHLLAHSPSSALLKNLQTFVDTPPCIGWAAPQIGTKDITILEIFCFVQPGHQGGRLFMNSPLLLRKHSKIESLKIPKSHTSFLFSLHIFD